MAVLLALLVVGIQVALTIPVAIADLVIGFGMHRPIPHLERQPIVIGCINVLAFSGAIALGLRLNRIRFRHAFPISGIPAMQAIGAAISLLGVAVLLSEVDNAFRFVLPPPKALTGLMKELIASEQNAFSRVLLLVIIAPVTEELLFRGIILRGLLSRHRPAIAVVLTALLFAILHFNPWQFLSALFLGMVLGWFYLRTGSVAMCIVGHSIANGLVVIFSVLPWDIPGMTGTPDLTQVVFQPWWLDVSGLVVLLLGLWLFRRATPVAIVEQPGPPVLKNDAPSSSPQ